ncbi:MAG: radical SAM family heme chaperone HemW [Planctomycetes bacterium]|nr:radical SAM family heme chaperone HemW [Planctomycetota bacterium]
MLAASLFGLYIHVPFCFKRCPYCAFVLIESDGSLHERFVGAVERQMERAAAEFDRPPFTSLYFGGGTPSLLEPAQIARLVEAARTRFVAQGNVEVTLEANPDGLGLGRLRDFLGAGVNRLSLGAQSTDDRELEFLGRTHTGRQALETYHAARSAGFHNISVDLIFGLPNQDVEAWKFALERWVKADVPHLSLYGLTVERGTPLERRRQNGLELPADETQKALYETAIQTLSRSGYRHYEISNFARPGFESRHNLGYWEGRPYLGFGPGAHSYVPPCRWAAISNVPLFIERIERGEPVTGMEERLTVEQRMLERIFLGLRRAEGVFAPAFAEEFGVSIEQRYGPIVAELMDLGLVAWRGGFLALTPRGKLLADSVIGRFA